MRHLAISVAAVAVFTLRRELRVSRGVLWALAATALVNMAAARLSGAAGWVGFARAVSTVFAINGWAVLVFLTGGIASPLVAGLWLEIVFSAMVLPPVGTLLVTGVIAAALWLNEAARGGGAASGRLWVQIAFVAAIGLLTFYVGRRWRRERQTLSVRARVLSSSLRDLEAELETARTFGQVGERVARLAHSLKNTVHSLRGFTRLIEIPAGGTQGQAQALEGLRRAIDGLEETARAALRPADCAFEPRGATTASDLRRMFDEVVAEVARDHVGIRWVKPIPDALPSIARPSSMLREVLLILARNGAEATGGSGEVVLRAEVEGEALRLAVQNQGPGFGSRLREAPLRPGVTTKPSGSGFGLFLARRLVESRGGRLTVTDALHGGGLVCIRLPVLPG